MEMTLVFGTKSDSSILSERTYTIREGNNLI
jgi:hypothetical protein